MCVIEEDGEDDVQLASTVNTSNHVARIHNKTPFTFYKCPRELLKFKGEGTFWKSPECGQTKNKNWSDSFEGNTISPVPVSTVAAANNDNNNNNSNTIPNCNR